MATADLVKAIDRITDKSTYRRTKKFESRMEKLMLRVAGHYKGGTQFPPMRNWKKRSRKWEWALLEIRRQELRLIEKVLGAHFSR